MTFYAYKFHEIYVEILSMKLSVKFTPWKISWKCTSLSSPCYRSGGVRESVFESHSLPFPFQTLLVFIPIPSRSST